MILIVDDDEGMADTCAMFLESQGFEVAVASSSAQALVQLDSGAVELLISDCSLPDMSGVELSQALRADPATAGLPILLMSGALRCDAAPGDSYDAFLRKPFLAEHLLTEVQKLLDAAKSPTTSN